MLLSTQVIENLVGGGADQLGLESVTATMDIDESASLDLDLDLFSQQKHRELDMRSFVKLCSTHCQHCRSGTVVQPQSFFLWRHADLLRAHSAPLIWRDMTKPGISSFETMTNSLAVPLLDSYGLRTALYDGLLRALQTVQL